MFSFSTLPDCRFNFFSSYIHITILRVWYVYFISPSVITYSIYHYCNFGAFWLYNRWESVRNYSVGIFKLNEHNPSVPGVFFLVINRIHRLKWKSYPLIATVCSFSRMVTLYKITLCMELIAINNS